MGTVLPALMEERDLSAIEVARFCGVTESTVVRWKAGKVEPRRGTAEKLAALFGCDRSEFRGTVE